MTPQSVDKHNDQAGDNRLKCLLAAGETVENLSLWREEFVTPFATPMGTKTPGGVGHSAPPEDFPQKSASGAESGVA